LAATAAIASAAAVVSLSNTFFVDEDDFLSSLEKK
jgi:hypothetical protein